MKERERLLHQGTFAFLPDMSDDQIEAQVAYALSKGWAISVELTDDPHPRNFLWDQWGLPLFDVSDPRAVLGELDACRKAHPDRYVKVVAFDSRKGRETTALSFVVQRPGTEPGFRLDRQTRPGRTTGFSLHAYAADEPHGERYQ